MPHVFQYPARRHPNQAPISVKKPRVESLTPGEELIAYSLSEIMYYTLY